MMAKRVRPFAVIDCESDPFKRGRVPEPFIWGFYDGTRYEEYAPLASIPAYVDIKGIRDFSEFIPFLADQEIIVYAHNGGKFDYHYLLDYLEPLSDLTIISGRLAKFKIGLCEFRDSYNIMPVALSQYEKMEFDYNRLEFTERFKPENWKAIRRYLYSDCLNLRGMVQSFIDRFGVQITQASASMKTWKTTTSHEAPHSSESFYDAFYPYYYGGRVECFQHGIIKKRFKVIDINSAYPFAMLSVHPIGLNFICANGPPDLDQSAWGPHLFRVSARSRGAFPFRAADKSLIFPSDNETREYTVTGWELLAAIETGTADAIDIRETFIFSELTDFSDYILPLYKERKAAKASGDKPTDLLCKLAMNGLYGKFAADPREYKDYLIVDMKNAAAIVNDPEYDFAGLLGPWALASKPINEQARRFYNVATAASITGYVRAYLWRAIARCDGVLYCDTDSIAAQSIGDIDISGELGGWSLDGEFSTAAIGGKKLYAFKYHASEGYKIASKGVRLNADEIIKICKGHAIEYIPEVPTYSVHKAPQFNSRNVRMTAKKS